MYTFFLEYKVSEGTLLKLFPRLFCSGLNVTSFLGELDELETAILFISPTSYPYGPSNTLNHPFALYQLYAQAISQLRLR